MKFNKIILKIACSYILLFSAAVSTAQTWLEIPFNNEQIRISGLANEIEIIEHKKSNIYVFEKGSSIINADHKIKGKKLTVDLKKRDANYQVYVPVGANVNCEPTKNFYEGSGIDSIDTFKKISAVNLTGNLDLTADGYNVDLKNHFGNVSLVTYGNIEAFVPDYHKSQKVVLDTYFGNINVTIPKEKNINLIADAIAGEVNINKKVVINNQSNNYLKLHSEKGRFINVGVLEANIRSFSYSPIKYVLDPNLDNHVRGEGELFSHTRLISQKFNSLEVANGIQLELISSNRDEVNVIAEKNIIPLVKTRFKDNELKIGLSDALETYKGIKVEVYTSVNSAFKLLTKSGSKSDIKFNQLENLKLTVMGGSEVELTGDIKLADIFVKEGSELDARECKVEELIITCLSASKSKVYAISNLTAIADNWAEISYRGNPKEKILNEKDSNSKIRKDRKLF